MSDSTSLERLFDAAGILLWLGGFVWLVTTPASEMPALLGMSLAYWLILLAALFFWVAVPVIKGVRTGDFAGAFLEALRSFILALVLGAVIWFIVSKLG